MLWRIKNSYRKMPKLALNAKNFGLKLEKEGEERNERLEQLLKPHIK